MAVPLKAKKYPYIGSNPAIADGKPIIIGTRITVRCIAGYYRMQKVRKQEREERKDQGVRIKAQRI